MHRVIVILSNCAGWIPIAVPVALAIFGIVTILLLLIGQLSWVVWPLGGGAAIAVVCFLLRFTELPRTPSYERRWCDLLMILFVIAWAGWNVFYTAQHIFTNRDPAAYAIGGIWLREHDSLKINQPKLLSDMPEVGTFSAGFTRVEGDDENLYVRGPHLFSGLLGLVGRIGGVDALLRFNVVVGAIAILAVYGFARFIMRPRWAVVAATVFAVTLPLLYFSRDTYTEPLITVLTFGALSALWLAQRHRQIALWGLAGLLVGAGTLARIDGYLFILAVVVYGVVNLIVTPKSERRRALISMGALGLGVMLTSVIGILDLILLTGNYFAKHTGQFFGEIIAITGVLIIGIGLVLLAWHTPILRIVDRLTRQWRVVAAILAIIIIAAILASRPLWYVSYVESQNALIASFQRAAGVPVEPRNYAEQTVTWVSWYLGPVMAILGATGLALAAGKIMKRHEWFQSLGPAVAIILGTCLVYLIRPSIFADQIWASRRLLPVILPGLAVFGAFCLAYLWSKGRIGKWAVIPLVVLAFTGPLMTSWPFLQTRVLASQKARINHVCEALPAGSILVWIGTARTEALQPTRLFCKRAVVGYGKTFKNNEHISKVKLQEIAQSARAQGLTPIIGLYGTSRHLIDRTSTITEVSRTVDRDLEQTLIRPPSKIVEKHIAILMGRIMPDGSVVALESVRQSRTQ